MKYRVNHIIQGSRGWYEWRRWSVTGSDIAAICGNSPYETRDEVLERKLTGRDKTKNYAMRRGTSLEPLVREMFEELMWVKFPPVCIENVDEGWMRASLDGLHEDQILEIKCPNLETHLMALRGEIPLHYMMQVQWGLFCTGLEVCWYVSYSDNKLISLDKQVAIVKVIPDNELQKNIKLQAEKFYTDLCEGYKNE
jgi:putative phage-type endonuclease